MLWFSLSIYDVCVRDTTFRDEKHSQGWCGDGEKQHVRVGAFRHSAGGED